MPGQISFASFNLYNFQLPDRKVYKNTVSKNAYKKKLEWTQMQILDLDADVIAFQELWAKEALDEVFEHVDLSGNYQLVYLRHANPPGKNNPWYGIAVAVAIRKPWKMKPGSKKLLKNFPFTNITKVDENDGEDDEVNVTIDRYSRTIIQLDLECSNAGNIPSIRLYAAPFEGEATYKAKKRDEQARSYSRYRGINY